MSRAGENPSAAMIRGIRERQAATVNSRWFRHSAAGVRLAAAPLARAASGPASQEISGGHSRQLRWRWRRAADLRAAALARSETGQRFPSSWNLNNSGSICERRTIRPRRPAQPRPGRAAPPWTPAPCGWPCVTAGRPVADRRGRRRDRLDQRRPAGPGGRRRAGGRGAGRRGAERGPRPAGPRLGVPAARGPDVLAAAAAAGCTPRPPRLAAAAGRGGGDRGGAFRSRGGSAARNGRTTSWQARPSSAGSWPRRPATRSSSASASTCPPSPAELPPPGPGALPATSLRILGVPGPSRERLLAEILAGFERWYQAWRQAGGDPERCGLRAEYTRLCATIGRRVRVELPGGQLFSGLAVGVDPDGRLLVRDSPLVRDSRLRGPAVAAGDVVHLR